MGRVKDWFEGKGLEGSIGSEPPLEPADSPYAGQRDLAGQPPVDPAPTPPGWYETEGTLRYFDGQSWTNHFAPLIPASLTTRGISGAVFLGVFAALFLVWLGAQIDPDHIYFPVKFVVEEVPEF